jgi:hypothetical protein
VARAEERVVGVESRREERTEGSRPGGGSIPWISAFSLCV